jgi:hypothetical protein
VPGSFANVTDEKKPEEKTLADRAKELLQGLLEALEDFVPQPEPELIPVRIPARRRRRRR